MDYRDMVGHQARVGMAWVPLGFLDRCSNNILCKCPWDVHPLFGIAPGNLRFAQLACWVCRSNSMPAWAI